MKTIDREYAKRLAANSSIHAEIVRKIIGFDKYVELLEAGIYINTQEGIQARKELKREQIQEYQRQLNEARCAIRGLIQALQDHKQYPTQSSL
ncbi:hypothetical protein BKH46_08865 [Helicobacter sp. 12S02634-8]|uniref:hypothetical protein n=1 Tax=Helicobacter sp. 12S02634-8 TaxID=1476199 RepID=UPI000BA75853|nr:hypothetical protein [Helicobacter sp. 12S02634-8]PAF46147.1 hypothetical protein BKH46_08865 [Helicobacter sp. 12S02634-8]